ncbi:chorismate mutase [Streptomyces sparsogenes DSM 40356]|uniref:Chorismate mutase n=1 Tax=Streptomyces sparsogenes DSM 40356 TaxID=1331668 RepID=A0A1R1SHY8_9ACTN|nr:chorismate mutase [Streptomyces sparsogenes DSM 40356]
MKHTETERTDGTAAMSTNDDIDESVRAELTRLRDSIDNIDAAVVHMLAERFKCTQQVGYLKAAHKLPRPTPPGKPARSSASATSRKAPSSTRPSRRSS